MTTPTPEELPGLGLSQDKIHALMSAAQILGEMMAGYRNKLINAGYSAESAERMAEEFHSGLVQQMQDAAAAKLPTLPNRQGRRHPR